METIILGMLHGTAEGKAMACEELRELGRKLDMAHEAEDSEPEMAEAGCYTCDGQLTADEHAQGDGNCASCFEKGEQS